MPAAPLPVNEGKRQQALDAYHILDTLEEDEFDAVVKLASAICGTPVALISLVDRDRQWFKARLGLDATETPRDQSFCAHAILNPSETLVVPDARKDPRFSDNPLVLSDPHIVFYAGVPLVNPDGQALGSLCVIDSKTHELNAEQMEALKVLGNGIITRLEMRRQLRELERANLALLENNLLIQKFARTAAHDIKNPLSSILLTSQLIERSATDEKQRAMATRNVHSCNQLIKLVNDMLQFARSASLANHQEIILPDLLHKVIGLLEIPDNIVLELPSASTTLKASPVGLEQIFLNLLTNAVRYNDKAAPKIRIGFFENYNFYVLQVNDNGRGIQPEHLGRIFDEQFTAGVADRFAQQGTGIGLYTVRMLVEKMGGGIHAESTPGEETTFHIQLPKPQANI